MIEKILSELGKLKVYKEIVTSDKHPFCASEIELLSRKKVLEIVQEVAKEYDWIPVEVAMPTEEGWYRVTCDNKKYWKTPMVRDLYYYPWIKCFVDNIRRSEHPYKDIKTFDWTEDVTAWKPVEAPYQKGE